MFTSLPIATEFMLACELTLADPIRDQSQPAKALGLRLSDRQSRRPRCIAVGDAACKGRKTTKREP
jgi:hypothetical protein